MATSVNGNGRTVGVTLQRPNDTNVYTAGDVMSDSTSVPTILTFPNAFGPNPSGFCILNQLVVIDSASQATKPDLELWLFDTAPAAQNDNAAFAPTDLELVTASGAGFIARILIPSTSWSVGTATVGAGGNCINDLQNLGIPITNRVSTAGLFGHVVVRNAYTPVAQEQFTFRLKLLD